MSKKFDYVTSQREDVDAIPLKWQSTVQRVMKYYTRLNVWVYKKTSGRLMRNFPGGYPICIVGMKGKKSAKRREIALIHLPWGDKKLLVASQGGMEKHPLWYFNIAAEPNIDIMVGGDPQHYIARLGSAAEKRELWPHLLSLYPDFDEYQARTDRDIPVFICTLAQ
jgi:deazaflavin-dependent oxidoreductase (nitroreductase family)